ncbi:MAG: hypothetical protein ACXWUG_09050 [Polyangiales bacterium]
MHKHLVVALSVSVGFVAGALGFAARSFADAPKAPIVKMPPRPVKPATPPTLPPSVIVAANKITITCPDSAPAMFATVGPWDQIAWAGQFQGHSYAADTNDVACWYVVNNDPNQIVTQLLQKVPAGAKNCVTNIGTKTVTCDKS